MEPPLRILPDMKLWRRVDEGSHSCWVEGAVNAVFLTASGQTLARVTWANNNSLSTTETNLETLLAEHSTGRLLTALPTLSPKPKLSPASSPAVTQRPTNNAGAAGMRGQPSEAIPPTPRHAKPASSPSSPALALGSPPPTGCWRGGLLLASSSAAQCTIRQTHLGPPFVSPSLPSPNSSLRITRRVRVEDVFSACEGALLATAEVTPADEALERELHAIHAAAVLEAVDPSEISAPNHIFMLPLSTRIAQSILRKPAHEANQDSAVRTNPRWLVVFISKRKMLCPPSKPAPPVDSPNKAALAAAAAAAAAAMADRLPAWLPPRAAFVLERFCSTREGAERAAAVARAKETAAAPAEEASERCRTVWANRIPVGMSDTEVVDLFCMAGEPTFAAVLRNNGSSGRRGSGSSRGNENPFAFIEYATVAEATAALQLSGLEISKRGGGSAQPLKVSQSKAAITKSSDLIHAWEKLQKWRCVKAASPAEAAGSPASGVAAGRFKRRAPQPSDGEEAAAKRPALESAGGEEPPDRAGVQEEAVAFLEELGAATADARIPAL